MTADLQLSMEQTGLEREPATDVTAALAAAINEASGSHGRAVLIRSVVDTLGSAVGARPDVNPTEADSLLPLLDAADEHCWRMRTGADCLRVR